MRNPEIRFACALIFLVVVAVGGCASLLGVGTETAIAKALISDEQSAQIGEQVHAELEKQGVRYVKDGAVNKYVQGVAEKMFAQARQDRAGIDYHVHVIDDPKQVNAFATPGGHIYVYSGLVLAAENEAELAGVLGHETGHVAGRHVERAMVNAYGLQMAASMALGQNPGAIKQIAAQLAGTGILAAHSRSEETEADEYGARYTSRVGYDPNAMITFFQKLQAKESKGSKLTGWLRTHPVTGARIEHLEQYIAQNHLRGNVLNAEQHRQIRQRLS